MQDAPSTEERMFKDKTAVRKDTPIKGVRMGAGDRSYLVRDNQIDVLKNMYGGVQVSLPPWLAAAALPTIRDSESPLASESPAQITWCLHQAVRVLEAALTLRDATLLCDMPCTLVFCRRSETWEVLQETGTSFNITPKKGGAFTPSKMLLMQRERRMNMLTPEQGSRMFNADIETGKILNEWSFQKDGVDVDIKDISNDTRAAGLDDRDTFLGLGGNR